MKKLSILILFLTIILILIGLVVVLTASSSISAIKYGDSFYMFKLHLTRVLWSVPVFLIALLLPYDFYKYISKYLIIFIFLLLILTLFVAAERKGASRWISIMGFQFQPTDPAKLFLIIHLSYLLEKKDEYLKEFIRGYLPQLFWISVISFLIFIQPNISNALLISLVSIILLYVGGASRKHIILTFSTISIPAISFMMMFNHSRERLLGFINSIFYGGEVNIQVKQALVSLGSGGIFGVGLGNSRQNNLFLPEAYGDFIFGILGEQFGIIGTLLVILIYIILVVSGFKVAKLTRDKFGQMLAFGISLHIGVFALANIMVNLGLLPTTGLPLPFISYGGTSIIFYVMSIGILINIAYMNYIRELERNKLRTNTSFNENE
jgi:cell division protein FtsW